MASEVDLQYQASELLTDLSLSERGRATRGFVDVLAAVITTTAANLGGVKALLFGDETSARADGVRSLLEANDPIDLLPYRTRRITLVVDVGLYLAEIGFEDLHEMSAHVVTAEVEAGELTPAAALELQREMSAMRREDEETWLANFTRVAGKLARDLGFTGPLEVATTATADPAGMTDEMSHLIFDSALNQTPLPGSGLDPTALPLNIAAHEAASGRLPHLRARERISRRTDPTT